MRLTRTGGRYLIVKLAALGDVVMASTLVGAIRGRDAEAHITWLCGSGVAPLVRLFDGVDEVVVVNELALLRGSAPARFRALLALWVLIGVNPLLSLWVLIGVNSLFALWVLPRPDWSGFGISSKD